MKSFEAKNALVTGGAAGIGRALALALAREGATVAFCDVGPADGVLAELSALGARVLFRRVDVGDREAMRSFVDEVLAELGHVDLLINNAGVALGDRTFEEVTFEDLERITRVNYWGTVHTTQMLYAHLLTRPEAAIVNLSSAQGIFGAPYLVPYCTTKFAVRGFTDALRVEHQVRGIDHVSVHCVHPGAVATDITLNADHHAANTQAFHDMLQKNGVTPDAAAKAILDGVRRGRSRIFMSDGRLQDLAARLVPTQLGRLARWLLRTQGITLR